MSRRAGCLGTSRKFWETTTEFLFDIATNLLQCGGFERVPSRSVRIFTMDAEVAQASEERHMLDLGRRSHLLEHWHPTLHLHMHVYHLLKTPNLRTFLRLLCCLDGAVPSRILHPTTNRKREESERAVCAQLFFKRTR